MPKKNAIMQKAMIIADTDVGVVWLALSLGNELFHSWELYSYAPRTSSVVRYPLEPI